MIYFVFRKKKKNVPENRRELPDYYHKEIWYCSIVAKGSLKIGISEPS